MELVLCTKCEETKEKVEFYKSKRYQTGVRQPCKCCVKLLGKVYRDEVNLKDKVTPASKVCNVCLAEKPKEAFNKREDTPTGLRSECKDCQNVKRHEHYIDNREHVLEKTGQYRLEHKEDYARWKRERRANDLEGSLLKEGEYREQNRERVNDYSKKWCSENPEKVSKTRKKYYYANLDKSKAKSYLWRQKNKDKVCYYSSMRRAKIKNATPLWSDLELIKDFYTEASHFRESIDHIIPLSHPLVCGLHVENNLQMLPLRDNIIKNNSFTPCEHVVPEWFDEEGNQ